jgi:hypothetical protein
MSTADKPVRSWQEIAAEAARETDPNRIVELSEELARALEERDRQLKSNVQSA